MNILQQDRIRGSLMGGAIGDALGYPVEFLCSLETIQRRYGERSITRLDTTYCKGEEEHTGKAVVSDDTQMTLFTANGILNAVKQGIDMKQGICRAYIEWYLTQKGRKSNEYKDCWIQDIPELNKRRAPGTTCMSALSSIFSGDEPVNNSKGCGGVMRVAPVALYAIVDERMTIEEVDRLAGDAAEITHRHPLGFIPAALMAHIVYRLALDEYPSRQAFVDYIREGLDIMKSLYPQHLSDVNYMGELAEQAILKSDNDRPDIENINRLGEGWVGEEALVVALYCALRYFDNFEEALIAAVNHPGDSDSTGAVCGNILGAAIGYDAIPQHFKDDVEMHDLILHMADDLYRGELF
ncbi:MAG: ADP-ribosylglycohydrolase family protein [Prevotella sp.]|nr:ADP-ribosylglycohydrolase family protein [Prevotella sp.]